MLGSDTHSPVIRSAVNRKPSPATKARDGPTLLKILKGGFDANT